MEESARARRVHNKLRRKTYRLTLPLPFELHATVTLSYSGKLSFVPILHACLLRFTDQQVVEVRPIPVRVRYLIMRARGHQKLIAAILTARPVLLQVMVVEGKAALQSTSNFGVSVLPGAPLRERPQCRQIIAGSEVLQKKIGKRCRRFSDDQPRMLASRSEEHTSELQ